MGFYSSPLISLTEKGLYCEVGDFYIDPHRGVETAVVTHGHSDHARRGSAKYITVQSGVGILKQRLGYSIQAQGIPYRESFRLGRVKVSFHPAGHILGSAQVRVECDGEVWVASGDYKRESDPSCEPFENVRCDTFITEATFGTPRFAWDKSATHGKEIAKWWEECKSNGKNAVLFGYSLGKAQRILAELYPYATRPVLIHSSVVGITECYRKEGILLAETHALEDVAENTSGPLKGELILAPPSVFEEKFASKLGEYERAFASGWMQNHSPYARAKYDRGFVMSDHADWNDLNQTVKESGAKRVFVQHRSGSLIKHLRRQGVDAHPEEMLKPQRYSELGGIEQSLW